MLLSSPLFQRHAHLILASAVVVLFALSCLISYALMSVSSSANATAPAEAGAAPRSSTTDVAPPNGDTTRTKRFSSTRFLLSIPFILLGLISLSFVVVTVTGTPGYDQGLVRLLLIPSAVFLSSGAGIAMSKGWVGFAVSIVAGGLLLLTIWGLAVLVHAAIWSR